MKSDLLHWPGGKTVEKYCIEPGTYCGLILVFSPRNAEPLAMINDGTQVLQFASVAGYVVRKAKELGLGQKVPTDCFTQDIRD